MLWLKTRSHHHHDKGSRESPTGSESFHPGGPQAPELTVHKASSRPHPTSGGEEIKPWPGLAWKKDEKDLNFHHILPSGQGTTTVTAWRKRRRSSSRKGWGCRLPQTTAQGTQPAQDGRAMCQQDGTEQPHPASGHCRQQDLQETHEEQKSREETHVLQRRKKQRLGAPAQTPQLL